MIKDTPGPLVIEEFGIELSSGHDTFDANLAYAYATSGRKEEATKIVKDLEDRQIQHSSTDASIALVRTEAKSGERQVRT